RWTRCAKSRSKPSTSKTTMAAWLFAVRRTSARAAVGWRTPVILRSLPGGLWKPASSIPNGGVISAMPSPASSIIGPQEVSRSSFQVQPSPILWPALHAGARRPGDAGFIDVLARRGVRFVAIVDDYVEADSSSAGGRDAYLTKGDCCLNAITG